MHRFFTFGLFPADRLERKKKELIMNDTEYVNRYGDILTAYLVFSALACLFASIGHAGLSGTLIYGLIGLVLLVILLPFTREKREEEWMLVSALSLFVFSSLISADVYGYDERLSLLVRIVIQSAVDLGLVFLFHRMQKRLDRRVLQVILASAIAAVCLVPWEWWMLAGGSRWAIVWMLFVLYAAASFPENAAYSRKDQIPEGLCILLVVFAGSMLQGSYVHPCLMALIWIGMMLFTTEEEASRRNFAIYAMFGLEAAVFLLWYIGGKIDAANQIPGRLEELPLDVYRYMDAAYANSFHNQWTYGYQVYRSRFLMKQAHFLKMGGAVSSLKELPSGTSGALLPSLAYRYGWALLIVLAVLSAVFYRSAYQVIHNRKKDSNRSLAALLYAVLLTLQILSALSSLTILPTISLRMPLFGGSVCFMPMEAVLVALLLKE